jgi:hypothetical protein
VMNSAAINRKMVFFIRKTFYLGKVFALLT